MREDAWAEAGIGDSLTKRGGGPVAAIAAMTGTDVAAYTRERPGMSTLVLQDNVVYHAWRWQPGSESLCQPRRTCGQH